MLTSKKSKRILMLVLVTVFVMAGITIFKIALSTPTNNRAFNERVAEIESRGENIDMLFVGGSRTYRSFDPTIFDEELGIKNSTNTGTPSQRSILNYYLLKQFLEKHTPKYVILGASYNGLVYEQSPHTFMLGASRLSLPNRIACAISSYGFNKGLLTLTGKGDYAENLHADHIIRNIKGKWRINKTKNLDDKFKVQPNGYLGSDTKLHLGGVTYLYDKTPSVDGIHQIDDKAYEYFDKSVQLCKEKGIEVILMSGPCTTMQLYLVDNYQEFVDFYADYAEKNGIKYYNLNYIKDREKLFPDNYFMDYLHVNYWGGQRISKIFAKIIKEQSEGKDTSHYFYKNLDEFKQTVHRIPGCSTKLVASGNKTTVLAKCLHNDDVTPEYRVLAYQTGKGYKTLTTWTTDCEFTYQNSQLKGYSAIKVEARTGLYPDELVAYSIKKLN